MILWNDANQRKIFFHSKLIDTTCADTTVSWVISSSFNRLVVTAGFNIMSQHVHFATSLFHPITVNNCEWKYPLVDPFPHGPKDKLFYSSTKSIAENQKFEQRFFLNGCYFELETKVLFNIE